MTRQEHLNWAKQRAMEYVNAGDFDQAFASMASDLGKHPELEKARELCGDLGVPMLMAGQLRTREAMTKFIMGFN